MTPSVCKNCHSGHTTTSPSPSPLRLSNDEKIAACSNKCTAEPYWEDWLIKPVAPMQELPWWVRSNFEKTYQAKASGEGRPALPFRVKVKAGQIDLHLIPKDFSFGLRANGGKFYESNHRIYVVSSPKGEITSQINIQDNQIPLLMKGLVNFGGIRAGLGADLLFETEFNSVQVGNYGDLHLVLTTHPGSRGIFNLLQPPGTPKMPVGFDWPHGDEPMDVVPWVYQDPSDPKRDLVLTQFLPEELLTPQARLPKAFDLEDLLLRVMKLVERVKKTPPKPGPPPLDLKEVLNLSNLRPGSHFTLKFTELTDLFLPGLLDLGPSSGQLQISLGIDGEILFDSSDLVLNLEAMDYPTGPTLPGAKPDPCRPGSPVSLERPGMRHHYATVSPGPERKDGPDGIWLPGIHGKWDAETGLLSLRANLHLDGQMTLPGLGTVAGTGDFLFAAILTFTPDGPVVLPKTTVLEFKDGVLFRIPDSKTKGGGWGKPLVQDLQVSLTDDPHRRYPGALPTWGEKPRWDLAISGLFPAKRTPPRKGTGPLSQKEEWIHPRTELNAQLEIPTKPDGAYDWSDLSGNLHLQGELRAEQPRADGGAPDLLLASFSLDPTVLYDGPGPWQGDLDYQILLDVRKGAVGSAEEQPLLQNAQFVLRRERRGCTDQWELAGGADRLELPQQKLEFNGLKAKIRLDQVKLSKDRMDISVPDLEIALNTGGSSKGPVRGLIALTQSPGKKLEITLDHEGRRLSFKGMDWKFQAQGLSLLGPGALRILDPTVRSLGLDGRLAGDFSLNFTDKKEGWNGSGLLQLLGDPNGDLYFLDGKGNRVGPPLVRNTHWDFKSVRGINWNRGYALGDFYLSLIINLAALNLFSGGSSLPKVNPAPGTVGGLGPFELLFEMAYDNQPATPAGFKNRIEDYLISICRQTPACVEKIRKAKKGKGGSP